MPKEPKSVMGVIAPPPRITRRGIRLLALVFGGPIILILFSIDLLMWLVF